MTKKVHKPACECEECKMEQTATEEAAQSLDEWAGNRKHPKNSTPGATISRNMKQLREMVDTRTWKKVRMGHLVALYAYCHEKVYGVPPGELVGYNYSQALLACKRLVTKECDGSLDEAIKFVQWTWSRERWVEGKRREQADRSGFRIGWKYQFGSKLFTDYRLDKARKGGLV
jgi:hypothetical protein